MPGGNGQRNAVDRKLVSDGPLEDATANRELNFQVSDVEKRHRFGQLVALREMRRIGNFRRLSRPVAAQRMAGSDAAPG